MLSGLFEKLPENARPLFHSDQGWQYQHAEYQRLLKEHNAKYVTKRQLYHLLKVGTVIRSCRQRTVDVRINNGYIVVLGILHTYFQCLQHIF